MAALPDGVARTLVLSSLEGCLRHHFVWLPAEQGLDLEPGMTWIELHPRQVSNAEPPSRCMHRRIACHQPIQVDCSGGAGSCFYLETARHL
jgi:hypothetical protein